MCVVPVVSSTMNLYQVPGIAFVYSAYCIPGSDGVSLSRSISIVATELVALYQYQVLVSLYSLGLKNRHGHWFCCMSKWFVPVENSGYTHPTPSENRHVRKCKDYFGIHIHSGTVLTYADRVMPGPCVPAPTLSAVPCAAPM